jgi:hypothetical protein
MLVVFVLVLKVNQSDNLYLATRVSVMYNVYVNFGKINSDKTNFLKYFTILFGLAMLAWIIMMKHVNMADS